MRDGERLHVFPHLGVVDSSVSRLPMTASCWSTFGGTNSGLWFSNLASVWGAATTKTVIKTNRAVRAVESDDQRRSHGMLTGEVGVASGRGFSQIRHDA